MLRHNFIIKGSVEIFDLNNFKFMLIGNDIRIPLTIVYKLLILFKETEI